MSEMSDQAFFADHWTDAWTEGLWAASWSRSVDGLTAEQAAWSPASAPGVTGNRHSIWQIVLHMCFWREDGLRRLTDSSKPSEAALAAGNFPIINDRSEAAWAAARERLSLSQQAVAAALSRPGVDISRLQYLLPHDCYHFGQINLIRAMLGLSPIE